MVNGIINIFFSFGQSKKLKECLESQFIISNVPLLEEVGRIIYCGDMNIKYYNM